MNKANSEFIYSTNKKIETVDNKKDLFVDKTTEIHFRKKNGKNIVIIKFLSDDILKLKKLSKEIKETLAIGGSIKKGEIILQGNKREEIIKILNRKGIKCKRVGG
ncbi:translation initiation factor [Bacteroidota bacterium]|nr:translation initiation factor [Bacteroidota bacterium]MDC3153673.1 translation initiation factor [Bacteroidota bacterium]